MITCKSCDKDVTDLGRVTYSNGRIMCGECWRRLGLPKDSEEAEFMLRQAKELHGLKFGEE